MTETSAIGAGDGVTNASQSNVLSSITALSPGALALQQFINFEEISLLERVGHGSYGVVKKASWGGKFVAVKQFNEGADPKAIETEVKQLSRVCHHNIIALYGISYAEQSTFLIMEYAEGGSLHLFLHGKVQPKYSTAHAVSWARQCAEGVAYLHAMKPKPLIHRDLKPLNLLLTNEGCLLKICDFGTVVDKSTLMTDNKGSAAWMAPEVFKSKKYNEKCDIFSWAIVLWEVLSRQVPFNDIDNTYSLLWKIHKGGRPPLKEEWSATIKDLMNACWANEPDTRPTMQHVVGRITKIASSLKGGDEPLKYKYVDQQIILTDSSDAMDKSPNDFDSSSSSTHGTPTNACINSYISNSTPTPTNDATTYSIETEHNQNTHSQMPKASIASSTRWDVIPESSESPSFNLNASEEAINRIVTIRNEMFQNGNVPMAPLSVVVDPNAWDTGNYDAVNVFSRSDGRERLTVTDTQPMMQNNPLDSDDEVPSSPSDATNPEDDENDGPNQSLDQMLEADLQPEQPLPDNPQSLEIYKDHQRLTKEYLRINTEIYYADAKRKDLLNQMDPAKRQEKEDLLNKMKEKEELLELCNILKQQLDKRRAIETGMVNSAGTVGNTLYATQRQISQDSNISSTGSLQNEVVADDGWVVIAPNQIA